MRVAGAPADGGQRALQPDDEGGDVPGRAQAQQHGARLDARAAHGAVPDAAGPVRHHGPEAEPADPAQLHGVDAGVDPAAHERHDHGRPDREPPRPDAGAPEHHRHRDPRGQREHADPRGVPAQLGRAGAVHDQHVRPGEHEQAQGPDQAQVRGPAVLRDGHQRAGQAGRGRGDDQDAHDGAAGHAPGVGPLHAQAEDGRVQQHHVQRVRRAARQAQAEGVRAPCRFHASGMADACGRRRSRTSCPSRTCGPPPSPP